MRILLTYTFFFLLSLLSLAQNKKKIDLLHADHTLKDEAKYPNAIVALGNVMVAHEGATLSCKQALIYRDENLVKAFGDVFINQGDTITQSSKYVHYDGKTRKAKSWGNVVLKDPKMTLTTDTLDFDRKEQLLYYQHYASIKDSTNTLKSKIGKYYLETNKFEALSEVEITNPDNRVVSEHLDYYTDTGIAHLYGPSTIYGEESTLYSEKGFHDSKNRISHFVKNAKILYDDRSISGDSLYYDENKKWATATGHIIVNDTINNMQVRGGYAEYYEALDSVFVVKKPLAISAVENDSTFMHADTLLLTGPQDQRIMRAFHRVKFFKSDFQGKCDSLYSDEASGLTKMFRRPVLWSQESQITGDSIYFMKDTITDQLDSLKVYKNAFVIQQDSTAGFNQIKGMDLYGKFKDDKISEIYVSGNGQMINYNRDENKELIGITAMTCSNMHFKFDEEGSLEELYYLVAPDGKTYPPSKFPEEQAKLPDFIWRDDERPKDKEGIFVYDAVDETAIPKIIRQEKEARQKAIEEKIKAEQEKLEKEKKEQEEQQNEIDIEKPKDIPLTKPDE